MMVVVWLTVLVGAFGAAQYAVDMIFDDGDVGGQMTHLKIVLDTGSAN